MLMAEYTHDVIFYLVLIVELITLCTISNALDMIFKKLKKFSNKLYLNQ